MRWLKAIIASVFGLFVDDGSFALAILAWLGAVWVAVAWLHVPPPWQGVILFAGLAGILVDSALRRARR